MGKRIFRGVVVSSALVLSVTAGLTTANLVFAAPPAKPSGSAPSGAPGGGGTSAKDVSHEGEFEFSASVSETGKTYESSTDGKNVILATDGSVNIFQATIKKTGDDDSGDSADFYGINAAVLSLNSSKIKISDSSISTSGKHANALFSYGDSTIEVADSTIKTEKDNSGALMVTGGGTLSATNVSAETDGNSSAPIRSDRGGGTMTISGGSYKSNGVGSPVIYSTADVTAKDGAKLESTVSEGAVIEGKNSISLDGVSVTANNTKLNSNSETYKTFFIYQSMSGDASEGTGTFSVSNSTVETLNGDAFFVTNTDAVINIERTKFSYGDDTDAVQKGTSFAHNFLKATASKWGNDGKNGGNVTLSSKKSPIYGGIVVDNISTADLSFLERTSFEGAINSGNTAKSVKVKLDSASRIVLTADSYISELENEVSGNTNIYANGHKLYVAGEEVSINQETPETWDYDFSTDSTEPVEEEAEADKSGLYILLGAFSFAFVVAILATFAILKWRKRAKREDLEQKVVEKAVSNTMKKPWEKK